MLKCQHFCTMFNIGIANNSHLVPLKTLLFIILTLKRTFDLDLEPFWMCMRERHDLQWNLTQQWVSSFIRTHFDYANTLASAVIIVIKWNSSEKRVSKSALFDTWFPYISRIWKRNLNAIWMRYSGVTQNMCRISVQNVRLVFRNCSGLRFHTANSQAKEFQ